MSHVSSACLFVDGELVAAIPEERLNRVKFSAAFPEKAIIRVMQIAGVTAGDIDQVAIGTRCEMFDSNRAQAGEYRKTTRMVSWASQMLPMRLIESDLLKSLYIHSLGAVRRRQFMSRYLHFFTELGIPRSKLVYYDHHTCHAATAYYLSPWREKTLIFTCDGNGDGDCGSVWTGDGNRLECRFRIPSIHSLGGLYSRTTKFMGMAPWQDEYKVMGLAPWGDKDRARPVLETFHSLWTVDGLEYRNLCGYAGDALIRHLRRKFKNVRFDYMAFGIQKFLEDLLTRWIRNNITHCGISRLAFSGGVFLNVKANKKIMEMPEVDRAFWFPAAGDDSIAIGSGILGTLALQRERGLNVQIRPMKDLYWGEPIDQAIETFLRSADLNGFTVETPPDADLQAAHLLAQNQIIARCTGRMEYGPRALGNRSILANPVDLENVQKLNQMIKCRDFWMPFAGTVLDSAAPRYLVNDKNYDSPYMILSFDTRDASRHEIKAATHQADGTIRPQILAESVNPSYYRLVKAFESNTGIGGVLNTSLNLHGDPMVNLPGEAFHVLQNSALKYLVLGKYLITKEIRDL